MRLRPGLFEVTVLPNPWHSVDHYGRPAGHCARPRLVTTVGHQGYIGCDIVASEPEKLPEGHQGTPYQDTCWAFKKEPEKYVDGPENYYYFKKAIANGEIIAADEKTAVYAGVKFVAYEEVIKQSFAEAAAKWKAATGLALEALDPFKRPMPNDLIAPVDASKAHAEETRKRLADASEPKAVPPSDDQFGLGGELLGHSEPGFQLPVSDVKEDE